MRATSPRPGADIAKVLGWVGLSLVSMCISAIAMREVAADLSVFDALAARSIFGVIALLALAAFSGTIRRSFATTRMGEHVLRNLIQAGGQYAWALAITLLPLAQVFAVDIATPILTAVLAVILLRERLTGARLLAIILGMTGMAVVNAPSIAASASGLLPLVAAASFAFVTILTKRLTKSESALSILFWMNVVQLPVNLLGAGPGFMSGITADLILPLAGFCVAGTLAQYAMTQALACGDAMLIAPLDFLRVPAIAAVGALVYGESITLSLMAGASIIAVGVMINLVGERKTASVFKRATIH